MKTGIVVAVLCILASVNASELDKPSSYIINGNDVSAPVPYFGYLEIYELPNLQGSIFFGGSTLITPNAVLTVAQNVVGFQSWQVGLGGYRISDLEMFVIATSIVHHEYNPLTLANNIAVLRLVLTVTISDRILPITRLPEFIAFPIEGTVTDVFGFGFGVVPEQPNILQEAQLTVISQESCGLAYPHLISSGQLQNHFCASNTTSSSNICAGDQGGPIVSPDFPLLIGLQSFNRVADCGHADSQPAAFIRVNQYNEFINNAVDG